MTIIPRFALSQDTSNIYVKIHVPYIRVVGSTEINISETEFHFYCKPYLLHISLPHKVLDEEGNCYDDNVLLRSSYDDDLNNSNNYYAQNDTTTNISSSTSRKLLIEEVGIESSYTTTTTSTAVSSSTTTNPPPPASPPYPHNNEKNRHAVASYDPNDNHGTLLVTLPKQIPGQYFPDLDLITKLLLIDDKKKKKNHHQRKDTIVTATDCSTAVIEVMDDDSSNDGVQEEEEDKFTTSDIEEKKSNQLENKVVEPCEPSFLFNVLGTSKDEVKVSYSYYGFLQLYRGVFTGFNEEIIQSRDGMLELPYSPECILERSIEERRNQRLQIEDDKFDRDRFLQDYDLNDAEEDGDMVYLEAIHMVPHWYHQATNNDREEQQHQVPHAVENDVVTTVEGLLEPMSCLSMSTSRSITGNRRSTGNFLDGENNRREDDYTNSFFTAPERDTLTKIGFLQRTKRHRKQQRSMNFAELGETDQHIVMLGLLDLLFAYCYDHRITGGEPSCESAWTVTILSPMLSWLEESYQTNGVVESITNVLCYSIRRSLIYPYIRNFEFSTNVIVEDVIKILCNGKRTILRCLLQIRGILEHTSTDTGCYYLLNTIFLDDYCTWIQVVDEQCIKAFSMQVREEVDKAKSQSWASERHLLFDRLRLDFLIGECSLDDDETSGNTGCNSSSSSDSSDTESTTSSSESSDT